MIGCVLGPRQAWAGRILSTENFFPLFHFPSTCVTLNLAPIRQLFLLRASKTALLPRNCPPNLFKWITE
ncbi:hypothetical protein P7K49_023797 [Saguinus oedipus]|uniref:Uncharacterized protein n=1 Tax=Saguinus oedipus TaxID=9490 RepID=A0ABQ9UND5_SAGOE|nr:hypothetical protein P7K49_023797 [Saguinus oedipus]